jgi:hypothetical protein
MSSQMTEKKIEITIADMAEEAMALNEFYRQRVLGIQAMRRVEAEQVKLLNEALNEVREELVKLKPTDPTEEPA